MRILKRIMGIILHSISPVLSICPKCLKIIVSLTSIFLYILETTPVKLHLTFLWNKLGYSCRFARQDISTKTTFIKFLLQKRLCRKSTELLILKNRMNSSKVFSEHLFSIKVAMNVSPNLQVRNVFSFWS